MTETDEGTHASGNRCRSFDPIGVWRAGGGRIIQGCPARADDMLKPGMQERFLGAPERLCG